MFNLALSLLVVFIPFLNFLLMLSLSNYTRSWRHLSLLVIGNMVILLGVLVSAFPAIARGESFSTILGNWILSDLFEVNWVFAVDALTYTMMLVVLSVSTLVHLYSTEYMSEDPHTARFISYLSLFTFFMLILVTANNFVSLFLGWEGVGLCSYLLISFWFTRIQANKAAIKAMVVNRVSDLFFTVGILAVFFTFQTVEFNTVFGLAPFFATSATVMLAGYEVSPLILITFLLFLGAMGKSAQVGLHTWLPDAMEGPTPVSALIHAATMVTAGVFLIIRCSPLFECAVAILDLITLVGAVTTLMAATSGLFQNDLKKVIAYSTCSQLGYMIFICGLSGYNVSLFHLSTHAFFKALLFLSAGAVIHAVASEQDMRKLGGLARILPYTYAAFFVGSIALMGVPFLSGFYSKDLILEVAGGTATMFAQYAYNVGLISAFFTAYYSFRLLLFTFYGNARAARPHAEQTHELSKRMAAALFVLALGSVFLGICGRDLFVGPGTDFWNSAISVVSAFALSQLAGEFMSTSTKLIPLISVCTSTTLVFYIYGAFSTSIVVGNTIPAQLLPLYRFLSFKWGFDAVYNQMNKTLLESSYDTFFKPIDKGVLEFIGPTGLGRGTVLIGRILASVQTGRAYDYAGFMLAALSFFLLFLHVLITDTAEFYFILTGAPIFDFVGVLLVLTKDSLWLPQNTVSVTLRSPAYRATQAAVIRVIINSFVKKYRRSCMFLLELIKKQCPKIIQKAIIKCKIARLGLDLDRSHIRWVRSLKHAWGMIFKQINRTRWKQQLLRVVNCTCYCGGSVPASELVLRRKPVWTAQNAIQCTLSITAVLAATAVAFFIAKCRSYYKKAYPANPKRIWTPRTSPQPMASGTIILIAAVSLIVFCIAICILMAVPELEEVVKSGLNAAERSAQRLKDLNTRREQIQSNLDEYFPDWEDYLKGGDYEKRYWYNVIMQDTFRMQLRAIQWAEYLEGLRAIREQAEEAMQAARARRVAIEDEMNRALVDLGLKAIAFSAAGSFCTCIYHLYRKYRAARFPKK